MKTLQHIAPLAAAVCMALASSFPSKVFADLKVVELAVETPADAAILPSGPSSTLIVTPCVGCKPLTLSASHQSRYFIGREQVTLPELKRSLTGRPKAMLVILYRKESRELSRVIATAPPKLAKAKR